MPPLADTPPVRRAAPAPAWLPAGWIVSPTPPAIDLERRAWTTYTPADRALPLVQVSRFTPDEARRLGSTYGVDGYTWLREALTDAVTNRGTEVGAARPWRGAAVSQGIVVPVRGIWPDGDLGLLAGLLAVGRTPNGGLLAILALDESTADPADVAALLPQQ